MRCNVTFRLLMSGLSVDPPRACMPAPMLLAPGELDRGGPRSFSCSTDRHLVKDQPEQAYGFREPRAPDQDQTIDRADAGRGRAIAGGDHYGARHHQPVAETVVGQEAFRQTRRRSAITLSIRARLA